MSTAVFSNTNTGISRSQETFEIQANSDGDQDIEIQLRFDENEELSLSGKFHQLYDNCIDRGLSPADYKLWITLEAKSGAMYFRMSGLAVTQSGGIRSPIPYVPGIDGMGVICHAHLIARTDNRIKAVGKFSMIVPELEDTTDGGDDESFIHIRGRDLGSTQTWEIDDNAPNLTLVYNKNYFGKQLFIEKVLPFIMEAALTECCLLVVFSEDPDSYGPHWKRFVLDLRCSEDNIFTFYQDSKDSPSETLVLIKEGLKNYFEDQDLQGQNYKFSRLIKDAAEHITRVGFSEETEE